MALLITPAEGRNHILIENALAPAAPLAQTLHPRSAAILVVRIDDEREVTKVDFDKHCVWVRAPPCQFGIKPLLSQAAQRVCASIFILSQRRRQ